MLQLIILAVILILLSVSVAGYSSIKEWYVWAFMLTDAYMEGFEEEEKLYCITKAAKKRFAIGIAMMPKRMYQMLIKSTKKQVKEMRNSFQNYGTLAMSIAYYDEEYKDLIRIIRDYLGI